jgi:hypothetical protein
MSLQYLAIPLALRRTVLPRLIALAALIGFGATPALAANTLTEVGRFSDTSGPFSFDRDPPFELKAGLAKEINRRRKVIDDDSYARSAAACSQSPSIWSGWKSGALRERRITRTTTSTDPMGSTRTLRLAVSERSHRKNVSSPSSRND